MVTGNLMWTAPIRAVHRATRDGRLGDLNPTPWAFMAGNCVGWVTYSFLIRNLFVFFANVFGFLLSIWLNMQAIKLQYGDFRSNEVKRSIVLALEQESRRSFVARQDADGERSPLSASEASEAPPPTGINSDQSAAENASGALTDFARVVWNVTAQNSKAPVAHEIVVLVIVAIWVAVISVISYGGDVIPLTTQQLVVGIVVNVNLIFFYGAPLSTILQVLRTRCSSSIHLPTMITNTANGIFWCAFGVAVMDWFILVPNGLGALLGGVQGALCVLFPRTLAKSEVPLTHTSDGENGPEAATRVDSDT